MSNFITPPEPIAHMLQAMHRSQIAYPDFKFWPDGILASNIGKVIAQQLGATPNFGIDGASKGYNGWFHGETVRICATSGRDFVVIAGKAQHLMVFNIDVERTVVEVVYNGLFDEAIRLGKPTKAGRKIVQRIYVKQLRALRDKLATEAA